MKTFLFQGDSITDAGRSRDELGLGSTGYPTFVEGILGARHPGEFRFVNKGISGNRVVDLYARIKGDIINWEPDILTILIGVNDVWHELRRSDGVDNAKYFKVYCALIEEIKAMCRNTEIFILEPFVLKASATEENWNVFDAEVRLRAESAKKVAEKYSLRFIPLQATLDSLCEKAPASYWLRDGVHPTAQGHSIIADKIISAVESAGLV